MPTPTIEAAKAVRENIARAKGALRRDDLIRTLNVTADSLDMYARVKVMGALRFELEVNLDELLSDLCRHTTILPMLPSGPKGKPFVLRYTRGKEALLSDALRRIAKILEQRKAEAAEEERKRIERHKQELLQRGQALLDSGDLPRARSFLRRAADEFGKEKGMYLDLAQRFRKAKLPLEAAEMYELALENFPKESAGWSGAIDMYMELQEFEKVEQLYVRVLQQFGQHPRTLCNIANFYLQWRRKGQAVEYALRALQRDPTLEKAREILRVAES